MAGGKTEYTRFARCRLEKCNSAQACLEYWCGYAEGCGIPVTDHAPLELFRQYHLVKSDTRYGLDDVVMVEKRR